MRNLTRTLLFLPALALVACGADVPPDQAFTESLVDSGFAVDVEEAELFIEPAQGMCDSYETGASKAEVITSMVLAETGYAYEDLVDLHAAAVSSYCPEYKD